MPFMHMGIWGSIEISLGPATEENSPGVMVLVLFLVAIGLIGVGHLLVPITVRRRAGELLSVFGGVGHAVDSSTKHRTSSIAPRGADKRTHNRRHGEPVPIWISENPDGSPKQDVTVLDRSRGGLLITVDPVDQRCDVGAIRYIRPHHAPVDMEWIRVEIRHCRQTKTGWLLGCKFSKELPWGVVLMFG
jgi:hypothetical protein